MARCARTVVPGLPHHVYQRGNRRMVVFFCDDDRTAYLRLLLTACRKYQVRIWAYCLMTNHVHLVAVPQREDSLARCFSDVHVRYTRRVNVREGWQGHLWQSRFGSSVVLDDRHLLAVVRYVERNPIRAGIVQQAWDYPWSSARWHVGHAAHDPLVQGDELLKTMVLDWRAYLLSEESPKDLSAIRKETRVNRPLGELEVIEALEQRVMARLIRKKPGPAKSGTVIDADYSVAVPDPSSVAVPDL